jgi:hypothetical protein
MKHTPPSVDVLLTFAAVGIDARPASAQPRGPQGQDFQRLAFNEPKKK